MDGFIYNGWIYDGLMNELMNGLLNELMDAWMDFSFQTTWSLEQAVKTDQLHNLAITITKSRYKKGLTITHHFHETFISYSHNCITVLIRLIIVTLTGLLKHCRKINMT